MCISRVKEMLTPNTRIVETRMVIADSQQWYFFPAHLFHRLVQCVPIVDARFVEQGCNTIRVGRRKRGSGWNEKVFGYSQVVQHGKVVVTMAMREIRARR